MVGLFVRLKLRLLANTVKGRGWKILALLVGGAYAGFLALAGFAVMATARTHRSDGLVIAVFVGTALALGWTLLPLMGVGSDQSLEPSRLVLFPLTRFEMMTGLLAASVVGVGGMATLIALAGALIGFGLTAAAALIVAAAIVVHTLGCVVLSRATLTSLSSVLRSRKGRDLRVLLVAVVVLAPQLLRFVRFSGTGAARFARVANVLSWLPTGLAMRAMVSASHGRLLAGAGQLVLEAAAAALGLWWWSAALDRIVTTAEATAPDRHQRTATTRDALYGTALAWLPRSRTGAVAARELRAGWRDPRRRVQTLTSLILPFFIAAGALSRGGLTHRPRSVYFALIVVGIGASGRAYNQIGLDGKAWWIHVAAGDDPSSDLAGKNVAVAVLLVVPTLVVGGALAILTRGWLELAALVPLSAGLLGLQLGIGNVLSVLVPWPVPESNTNLWSTNTGQGCLASFVGLAGIAVATIAALPFAIALFALPPGAGIGVGVASAAAGALLWALGTAWAVRWSRRRGPELLATVSGR